MNMQRRRVAHVSCLILFGALAQTAICQEAPAKPQMDSADAKELHDGALLYGAHKVLEGLPIFEDLCLKMPNVGMVAEWHGAGLIAKAETLTDATEHKAVMEKGIAEIRRARSLGDNSQYVQIILDIQDKSSVPLDKSGRYVTVGYSYGGKPEAQASFKEAQADFSRRDFDGAAQLYKRAAAADPAWYDAALFAGDAYFAMKDAANAAVWFQKAIAIDPDRETAYRYWGDALDQAGDTAAGKVKFEQAFVAEPYGKTTFLGLQQWARFAHAEVAFPQIVRPDFTTAEGKLVPDSALASQTGDGRSSWLVYQRSRVGFKATTLNQTSIPGYDDGKGTFHITGYRHTLDEENASIKAMLSDVQSKLNSGSLSTGKLDPSITLLMKIDFDGFLNCWILLNASDAGIRADYPAYRAAHRDVLVAFVDRYMVSTPSKAQ